MPTYFVLQPGSWPHVDQHLCRPLVGTREQHAPHIPWVSVARSTRFGEFALVRRDGLDGAGARALVDEAQAWLDANQRQWQVVERRGFLFWKRPGMIRPINTSASGLTPDPMDDLSAEQILSPRAMYLDAIGALGTTELIATVPKRGWLLLMPGIHGDLLQANHAHRAASGVFQRAGADALSDTAFFLRAGELIGVGVQDARGGYFSLMKPEPAAWRFPEDPPPRGRAPVPDLRAIEQAVVDLVEASDGGWGWKDLALRLDVTDAPPGFNLVTTLKELTARGVIDALADERGHGRWRIANGAPAGSSTPRTTRVLHIGARAHRVAVQLAGSSAWQDTGLQPDVLATRPLLVGYSIKLQWKAVPIAGARVEPVIELRHVPDPSLATRDRTFAQVPIAEASPVIPSYQAVPLRAGAWLRFPREPGRIEARLVGAVGLAEIFEVAGHYRLELHVSRAGIDDVVLREPRQTIELIGSDELPALPALQAEDPLVWQPFAPID